MKDDDLSKVVSINIPLGHLVLAWETLSEKFSDLRSNETLSEEERKAIWGLADLLENSLVENGIESRPQAEWLALINRSKEFINKISVDFLN
jgi:hypothetical protein